MIGYIAGYGIGAGLSGIENPVLHFGASVIGGGVVSGGLAELAGGDFADGFATGATGAALGWAVNRTFVKNDNNRKINGSESHKKTQNNIQVAEAEFVGFTFHSNVGNLIDSISGTLLFAGPLAGLSREITWKVFLESLKVLCSEKVMVMISMNKMAPGGTVFVSIGPHIYNIETRFHRWYEMQGSKGCLTTRDLL